MVHFLYNFTRYYIFFYRISFEPSSDHFKLCRRLNSSPWIPVFPNDRKVTKNTKSAELIQRFEQISITSSSSDQQPNPKVPRIKLKLRRQSAPNSSRLQQTKDKASTRFSTQCQQSSIQHEKPSSSESEKLDDSGLIVDDQDFSPGRNWQQYKCLQRFNSERNQQCSNLSKILSEISAKDKKYILLKNNLLDLNILKQNTKQFKANEFEIRKIHHYAIDRHWSDEELKLYSSFWSRKLGFMRQCSSESPKVNRKSFRQCTNPDRVNNILYFLLKNSVPAANRSKDLMALKTKTIFDKTLQKFYR